MLLNSWEGSWTLQLTWSRVVSTSKTAVSELASDATYLSKRRTVACCLLSRHVLAVIMIHKAVSSCLVVSSEQDNCHSYAPGTAHVLQACWHRGLYAPITTTADCSATKLGCTRSVHWVLGAPEHTASCCPATCSSTTHNTYPASSRTPQSLGAVAQLTGPINPFNILLVLRTEQKSLCLSAIITEAA